MRERELVGNMRRAGVFSRRCSAEFYPLHKNAIARAFFRFACFHHKNSGGSFLPRVGGLMSSMQKLYKEPWGGRFNVSVPLLP